MNATTAHSINVPGAPTRQKAKQVIPSSVMAMLLFIACEIMFFAALISARLVVSAGAESWPPAGQPRLPILTTAFNTLVLLASGGSLFLAARAFGEGALRQKARRFVGGALLLGIFFVIIQGIEWVRLMQFGLTMRSSNYGSFFYIIIGAHALHAIAAIVLLGIAYRKLARNQLTPAFFGATQVFWYFVVGLWPFLYVLVYLR